MKMIDLTGQNFGELTVLCREGSERNRPLWKCQCSCGNICYKTRDYLKGKTKIKSCGCQKSTLVKEFNQTKIKDFMNKLLRAEVFDHFLLQEAVITGAATYTINGQITKGYFDEEELSVAAEFEVDCFADDIFVEGMHLCLYGVSVGRRSLNDAEVASPHKRKLQSTRYRGSGKRECVDTHLQLT